MTSALRTLASTPPAEVLDEGQKKAGEWFDFLLGAPLKSLVAVLVGVLVLVLARWMIGRTVRSVVAGGTRVRRHARRLLMRTNGDPSPSDMVAIARRVQRAETMGSVLRSAVGLVVGIGVLTAVANINEWELGPVLASAGVAGVALGFGAQTLVKDFLSGLFMLIEDQYGVGDVVDLGEASGTVEAIGLRVTQVRDVNGTLWYVRNGEVLRVGNMTQGYSKALVDVRVPADQDIERVSDLLRSVVDEVAADEEMKDLLLGEPEVLAYEDLTAEGVRLRLMIKTAPAQQWTVQRAIRSRLLASFARAGVPLAIPRREVLVERPAGEPPHPVPPPEPAADQRGKG